MNIKVIEYTDQIIRKIDLEYNNEKYFVDLYFTKKDFKLLDIVIKDLDGEGYSEFSNEGRKEIYNTISNYLMNNQFINKKINKYKCQI